MFNLRRRSKSVYTPPVKPNPVIDAPYKIKLAYWAIRNRPLDLEFEHTPYLLRDMDSRITELETAHRTRG